MSEHKRPIIVPDLAKPAGASVDAHGDVHCVTCGKTLPQVEADVVGLGYRCTACGANASADDLEANLDAPDRARVWPAINGRKLIGVGVALLVLAVAMWILSWDIAWHSYTRGGSVFVYVCIAAIGCIGVGLANLRGRR
ncbi:MAG: hypothetical protein ABJE66_34385 [Deltaproteobacteria bacterium]